MRTASGDDKLSLIAANNHGSRLPVSSSIGNLASVYSATSSMICSSVAEMGSESSSTWLLGTLTAIPVRYSGLCHGTMDSSGLRVAQGKMNLSLNLSSSRMPASPHCRKDGPVSSRESSPRARRRHLSSSSTRAPSAIPATRPSWSCISCLRSSASPTTPRRAALPPPASRLLLASRSWARRFATAAASGTSGGKALTVPTWPAARARAAAIAAWTSMLTSAAASLISSAGEGAGTAGASRLGGGLPMWACKIRS
mmetsp:Transcript_23483/g.67974  ORF Transcript_23483/g.67974 Transcript_23483/m.67974 type:complete len:255 (+) Transcript_23483:692-1456(+)